MSSFPAIIQLVAAGKLVIDILEMPLQEVAAAWNLETANGNRIVLLP